MTNETTSTSAAIAAELLAAARESEDLKKAGKTVGRSLATIASTIDNALLPLAAVNFGIRAAKDYFSNKFQKEFADKVASIPSEHIVDPKPSVAGPALQGLSFSLDEPNLKDMYLNLLRTAVDGRVAKDAHPAFVEIIRQISGEEVQFLNALLRSSGNVAAVRLKYVFTTENFVFVERHLIGWQSTRDSSIMYSKEMTTMIDNWLRLGLLSVDYGRYQQEDNHYDYVTVHPRYLELASLTPQDAKLDFDKGIAEVTDIGRKFARAIGVTNVGNPDE